MKHKDVTMPTRPHWVVEVDLFARFSCNEGTKDQEHQENRPQLHHQRFNVQDRNIQKILNQDNLANRKIRSTPMKTHKDITWMSE